MDGTRYYEHSIRLIASVVSRILQGPENSQNIQLAYPSLAASQGPCILMCQLLPPTQLIGKLRADLPNCALCADSATLMSYLGTSACYHSKDNGKTNEVRTPTLIFDLTTSYRQVIFLSYTDWQAIILFVKYWHRIWTFLRKAFITGSDQMIPNYKMVT